MLEPFFNRSKPKSDASLRTVQYKCMHVCAHKPAIYKVRLFRKNVLRFFPRVMKRPPTRTGLSTSLRNDITSSPRLHSQHCSSEVGSPVDQESDQRFSSSGAFVLVPVFYHKHTQLQTHLLLTREVKTND